uniref:FHA domain-containing protein n=1 Tax=Chromera velia CCMP2878 TaxID=1169474 RepID=A0A0G4EZ47_9ALVE|eukprot:Cvel_14301.t1-p1 / transcript=Cvel_14301.t1 / gene=Cvel_14301 / organism=Chromera_velia_CCMP2878 / gene_product=hypothetical protein / transcript_product=hypothetical protein / location=Cvel_scaffold1011:1654-6504(-) / protein_length=540 / sequence_SO=supercontig / SO=protein_coding / is_pseudo=false
MQRGFRIRLTGRRGNAQTQDKDAGEDSNRENAHEEEEEEGDPFDMAGSSLAMAQEHLSAGEPQRPLQPSTKRASQRASPKRAPPQAESPSMATRGYQWQDAAGRERRRGNFKGLSTVPSPPRKETLGETAHVLEPASRKRTRQADAHGGASQSSGVSLGEQNGGQGRRELRRRDADAERVEEGPSSSSAAAAVREKASHGVGSRAHREEAAAAAASWGGERSVGEHDDEGGFGRGRKKRGAEAVEEAAEEREGGRGRKRRIVEAVEATADEPAHAEERRPALTEKQKALFQSASVALRTPPRRLSGTRDTPSEGIAVARRDINGKYCASASASASVASEKDRARPPNGTTVVARLVGRSQKVEVWASRTSTNPVVIGRSATCELTIDSKSQPQMISRRHAHVFVRWGADTIRSGRFGTADRGGQRAAEGSQTGPGRVMQGNAGARSGRGEQSQSSSGVVGGSVSMEGPGEVKAERDFVLCIRDNRSLNGLFVNGKKTDESVLRDGDEIHFGGAGGLPLGTRLKRGSEDPDLLFRVMHVHP